MKYKKINNLNELREACYDHSASFVMQLNFGLRSSKDIEYNPENKKFSVYNYIDDSDQLLTEEEIMDANITNIGKAISYGSFFLEERN